MWVSLLLVGIIFLQNSAAVKPFQGSVIALHSQFRVGLVQTQWSLPFRECWEDT